MSDSTSSIAQQLDCSEGKTLLVIDGDAIPYMMGWHHRDHQDTMTVFAAIDQWFKEFFLLSSAEKYIGILAPESGVCFRKNIYKYKVYKGNRPEKEPWILFWEPIIRQYLITKYGFQLAPSWLETDDVVAGVSWCIRTQYPRPFFICSPDKDLKQIPGNHLDYRKVGEVGGGIKQEVVTEESARYNWCMQMLCGDSTDNIAGVPGLGEKKAKLKLDEAGPLRWNDEVKLCYFKYFGDYYGKIIYNETANVITLLTPNHQLWDGMPFYIEQYLATIQSVRHEQQPFYSETQ